MKLCNFDSSEIFWNFHKWPKLPWIWSKPISRMFGVSTITYQGCCCTCATGTYWRVNMYLPATQAPQEATACCGNRYRKLPRFTRKLPSTTLLPNLKSALFGSCPDLIIKERTAAALAWHGGHWPCDWCRAAAIQYRFEQRSFRLSAHILGRLGRMMIASVDKGHQQEFCFLCFAPAIQSATVLNLCLIEFVPSWLVRMTMPRSCLPILVFSHHQVVLSRAGFFAAYLAAKVRAA